MINVHIMYTLTYGIINNDSINNKADVTLSDTPRYNKLNNETLSSLSVLHI